MDNLNETDLLLLIQELDKRISKLEEMLVKTGSGVITSGAPNYIQEFLDKRKEAKK